MKTKTLYFEGAGWVPCNDVENCRIRTAFTNKEGEKIYIEFLSGGGINNGLLFCDYCYYITENPDVDDCNKSRLKCEGNQAFTGRLEYSKKNILSFVNKYCNADFDEIVVLDSLAGYRVFTDKGRHNTPERYNFGDCFEYDEELTKKRIAKVEEMKKYFSKLFNQKYDNTSYYIEDGKLTVMLNVSEQQRIKAGYNERKFIVEL